MKHRPRFGHVDDFVNPQAKLRGPNGKLLCRVCGTEVSGRRRTFCSSTCVETWNIRNSPGFARKLVRKRDKGVCAECGLECVALKALILHAHKTYGFAFSKALRRLLGIPERPLGKTLWEAHHIVAVAEGGGSCDLDGFATVCIWCHRQETRALMQRLRGRSRPVLRK